MFVDSNLSPLYRVTSRNVNSVTDLICELDYGVDLVYV